MAPDYERLQTALDDVAGTVEWAAKWIEILEEDTDFGTSDLAVLKAEAARLRAIADALVPGRVRDPSSGRRWYLAPDEVAARERILEGALEQREQEVDRVSGELDAQRREEERAKDEREEQRAQRHRQQQQREDQEQAQVATFLGEHGAATLAEIKRATGLSEYAAERAAKAVAKRRQDKRFELTQ